MSEQFANNFSSTLASTYTTGQGSITLNSTSGCPSSGTFTIAILNQTTGALKLYFRVTSIAGAVLTGAAEGIDANASSGDIVIGTMLSTAALGQTSRDHYDILSLDRWRVGGTRAYSMGKNATLGTSSPLTVLSYTGSGYVDSQWYAITSSTPYGFVVTVVVDGTTIYSGDYECFMGSYEWNQTAWHTFGNRLITSWNGLGSHIPIPFSSSISITITNNSGSSVPIWYQVGYVTGVTNLWPRTRNFKCVTVQPGQVTKTIDQTLDLVNVSSIPRGRLAGIGLWIDGSVVSSDGPLEGAIEIACDGTIVFKSSGTEDYMMMAGYFANVSAGTGNEQMSLTIKNGSHKFAFLRFHLTDPITFENALRVTWHCGDSSVVNFGAGLVYLGYSVWYYTE